MQTRCKDRSAAGAHYTTDSRDLRRGADSESSQQLYRIKDRQRIRDD